VGDIDFKVISATENSNKFQKTRFWKEKLAEDVATLGPSAQATLVVIKARSGSPGTPQCVVETMEPIF
jgi:hypothetical protein